MVFIQHPTPPLFIYFLFLFKKIKTETANSVPPPVPPSPTMFSLSAFSQSPRALSASVMQAPFFNHSECDAWLGGTGFNMLN
jgi:hypothetical protein